MGIKKIILRSIQLVCATVIFIGCNDNDIVSYIVKDGTYLQNNTATSFEMNIKRTSPDILEANLCNREGDTSCVVLSSDERYFDKQCYTQTTHTCEMEVFHMGGDSIVLGSDMLIVNIIQAWFEEVQLDVFINGMDTSLMFEFVNDETF